MNRLRHVSFRLGLALAALAVWASPARADDESTDAAAASPAPAPAAAPAADAAAADAAAAAAAAAPQASLSETDTVSGVKLGASGTRQRVHVLINRRERAEGKHELSLFGTVQVNGKFTQHIGTGLEYGYHLREAFALTAGGTWFAYAANNSFSETELLEKARQQSLAGSLALLRWEAHAGLEVAPIYGKFAFFNYGVVQFGFYMGTSLGVGGTQLQLSGENSVGGRTYGATGLKPVGVVNAGFRMFFSERIAVRAEIRDTVFSTSVDNIEGCTYADVKNLKPADAALTCPGGDQILAKDIPQAQNILKEPSAEVLNNVAFTAALSVLF